MAVVSVMRFEVAIRIVLESRVVGWFVGSSV